MLQEVSTLMATWVSKASEKQRRGRAGRCQPVSHSPLSVFVAVQSIFSFSFLKIRLSWKLDISTVVRLKYERNWCVMWY